MSDIDLTDYERPVRVLFRHDGPEHSVSIAIPILVSPDWVCLRYDLTDPVAAFEFGCQYRNLGARRFQIEVVKENDGQV